MLPKLIVALENLDTKDWAHYGKYVLMQTRADADPYLLFTKLKRQKNNLYPFDSKKWRAKNMPTISEKAFLNTLSKLYLWLEEWVVYDTIKKDKVRSGIELVRHFNRKGQYKLADSKAKQVQRLLDDEKQYSPQRDALQYELYYYQFYSDNPVKDKDPQLVFKMVDSYLTLRSYTDSLMRSQVEFWSLIRAVDQPYIDSIRETIVPTGQSELLQHFLGLTHSDSKEGLLQCFDYLQKGKIKRDDDFFTILTMHLLTLSLRMWHKGIITDFKLLTDLWEFALDKKVLMNAGKIPFKRFTTIVNTLGAFSSFEWTNAFIEKWAPHVDDVATEEVIRFAMAANYFHHQKFEESLQMIHSVSIKFVTSRSIIHRLAIMIYFETKNQNYDLLINALERFQSYLRRRAGNQSDSNIKMQKNFIAAVRYLDKGNCTLEGLSQYFPASNTLWLKSQVPSTEQ